MNNTFDDMVSFLMESKDYKNFIEIYQDYKIQKLFFDKIEEMTTIVSNGNEKDFKNIENIVINYLADIEKVNFILGIKFSFMFFEEMKRGCFNE